LVCWVAFRSIREWYTNVKGPSESHESAHWGESLRLPSLCKII
jgi:hypothetical protein